MPTMPLSPLRAQAEELARSAPRYRPAWPMATASHFGSVGRARAGDGENFWQYRRYAREDGAQRIDWRRSAREQHLYVRENEHQTPRRFLMWLDPGHGFHWRSRKRYPTKASRAVVALTALTHVLIRAGERCGALGGRPDGTGLSAISRCAEDMWTDTDSGFPTTARRNAIAVLASDFYQDPTLWKQRLAALSASVRCGILVRITDPVESAFPFRGRMRLRAPGSAYTRLFGRTQSVRDDYLRLFADRRQAVTDLARDFGWRLIEHSTDQKPGPLLASLVTALGETGWQ